MNFAAVRRRLLERPWCALAVVYLLFAALQPTAGVPYVNICIFNIVTGLPCALCGMTRGLTNLLHFDPVAAVAWHPLAPLAPPMLAIFVVYLFVADEIYQKARERFKTRAARRAILGAVALFLVFGAARAAQVGAGRWRFPFY